MSKREDIIEGKDAQKANYGLVYSCNCGWLDLGHLTPSSKDARIGAQNLWKKIKAGGSDANAAYCSTYIPDSGDRSGGLGEGYAQYLICKDDPSARFRDGAKGFRVSYRQEMAIRVVSVAPKAKAWFSGDYLVRHNLDDTALKSVALAIFLEVSYGFENLQGSLPFSLRSGDSSFSQEDLVSNLIGFYIAVGAISREEAIRACHPVSKAASLAIWDNEGSVGSRKNHQPTPLFATQTGYEDPARQMCVDECMGRTKTFPSVFQSIKPAPKGLWHIDMPYLPEKGR